MVEVLKQPQYVPVPEQEQIYIIFAGIHGVLDDLPVEEVHAFELGLRKFIAERYPEVGVELERTKVLSDDLSASLMQAVEEFKTLFVEGRYRDVTDEELAEQSQQDKARLAVELGQLTAVPEAVAVAGEATDEEEAAE